MAEEVFQPLPTMPDHPSLEEEVLAWWEQEGIFGKLRERNRGGPSFSFVDGPVTANKPMGVHTAWGRTLKDVFQRYKALRGFDERYQNGFDCQGLWIEVGVERELGLNSKREIEEYGLEAFARKCRDVVVRSSREITRASKRLGQWMDWGNDYFTFSDTNIEYVWRMLKHVHERDWLYLGHRSTEWCPRCGTSISQHELTMAGVYQDRADPSLFVRFPLLDHRGESLVIWTTTPWTLAANVAAAVNSEADYGRRANGEWVAVARYPDDTFEAVFCSWLFEHLDDPDRAMAEIRRVLKPDGMCYLVVPSDQQLMSGFWDDYTHVRAFTKTSLLQLANFNGFTGARAEFLGYTRLASRVLALAGPEWTYRYLMFGDRFLRRIGIVNRNNLVLTCFK